MRYFTVTVHSRSVHLTEVTKELKPRDCVATVDGKQFVYSIKKGRHNSERSEDWRSRAYYHIRYHANNSGTVVHFEPVNTQSGRRRKISEKQLSFLD